MEQPWVFPESFSLELYQRLQELVQVLQEETVIQHREITPSLQEEQKASRQGIVLEF
jgi:hypothetical protein